VGFDAVVCGLASLGGVWREGGREGGGFYAALFCRRAEVAM